MWRTNMFERFLKVELTICRSSTAHRKSTLHNSPSCPWTSSDHFIAKRKQRGLNLDFKWFRSHSEGQLKTCAIFILQVNHRGGDCSVRLEARLLSKQSEFLGETQQPRSSSCSCVYPKQNDVFPAPLKNPLRLAAENLQDSFSMIWCQMLYNI